MRNAGAVRAAIAGGVLFAAVCALPPSGIGAGDGAVLNGMRGPASEARALNARPDTSRHAGPRAPALAPRSDGRTWKTPPIDLRALSAGEPRPASEPAQVPQTPRRGASGSAIPLVVAAVFVAACSTAIILFFVARASARRSTGPVPVARAPRVPEYARAEEGEAAAGTEQYPPVREEEEDGFFGVGRDLRGAREEMALAMRLHSGAMGDGSRRSARSACAADATTAERVKVAKRLGIGRGEIDLALRLQKLESKISSEVKTA